MTPQEALQLLNNVTSQIALKKSDHLAIENALVTLKSLIPVEKPALLVDADKKPDKL